MGTDNPEVGLSIRTGTFETNYHDIGDGSVVLLLHGSGPGVSAWANWRLPLARLQGRFRCLAPDLVGFGYTEVPADVSYERATWLGQILAFLDALGISRCHVIGNSFGGSMALALAIAHPERVDKLVLMGSVGVPFAITQGLDDVWGFEPSEAEMGRLMREVFAYDPSLVTDELITSRYAAATRPGAQEAFSAMFPAPRQRWVDAMAHDEDSVRGVRSTTLLVHGRDDKVIPLSTTMTLLEWIDDSQAHIFGRCGHWTQIEHPDAFADVVTTFLAGG